MLEGVFVGHFPVTEQRFFVGLKCWTYELKGIGIAIAVFSQAGGDSKIVGWEFAKRTEIPIVY